MITTDELETRLTATLRAVADQTTVTAPARPTAPITPAGPSAPADDPGRPPNRMGPSGRALWLAAAAAITIAIGSVAYLASSQDQVAVEAADDPTATAPTATETLPIGEDGVLHLLPPDLDQGPFDQAEFASGDDVVAPTTDAQMLVGRRTDTGYEDLLLVFHTTTTANVALNEDSSETVAGRVLIDSFDEGVIEEQDDGSWIVYQDEFMSIKPEGLLEDVVAGTTLVDGDLAFDPRDTGLEVIARIAPGDPPASSTLTAFIDTEEPPAPGQLGALVLTTFAIDDPEDILIQAGELAPSLTETTIDGRRAHQYTVASSGEGTITMTAWSPAERYGAFLITWGLSATEAAEYASAMEPIDGATWAAALDELG